METSSRFEIRVSKGNMKAFEVSSYGCRVMTRVFVIYREIKVDFRGQIFFQKLTNRISEKFRNS